MTTSKNPKMRFSLFSLLFLLGGHLATGVNGICDAGFYSTLSDSGDEVCLQCSECVTGAYISKECKTDADTVCTTCPPTTFLEYINAIPTCRMCTEGSYCPGDGIRHNCSNNKYSVEGSMAENNCAEPVCGNGILEGDEECDDGGRFNTDGCTGTCKFEDSCACADGAQWVCTEVLFEKTSCCKSFLNPVTQQHTCSCAGQESDNPGYKILTNCQKQDINECMATPSVCASNAVCTNYDATIQDEKYTCTCPPGLLGDGVTRCDMYSYETVMTFVLTGVRSQDIEIPNLIALLNGVHDIFPVPPSAHDGVIIKLVSKEDFTGKKGRMLLQSDYGVYVKVIVMATDAMSMQNFTQAVDVNGLTVVLAEWYNVDVTVKDFPQNVVQTVDSVYGAVNTIMSGFRVDRVIYNATGMEWLVTVSYVADSPNTLTSLYVSKCDDPPYSQTVLDSFFISKHPCMNSMSVCCLNEYAAEYYVGDFKDDVASEVGTCDYNATHTHTLDLLSPSKNDDYLLNALSGVVNSRVTRIDDTTLMLHIDRMGLRNQVATREAVVGGFKMDFFVGMSYFTLLPTNALATVASQVAVHVTSTDAVSFATTSEQDYSFIQYITMNLFQTKYVENMLVEHYMQFVKVGVVIPEDLKQNMETGLIPLKSIRFAVSQMPPDVDDATAWGNPCYSDDNTGLMDDATSSLRELYGMAEQQTCALQSVFCVNPVAEVLPTGFVEIWLPIGDNTISASMLQESSQYSLYVYFDISIVQANGKKVVAKLYSQASLTSIAIARACETMSAAETMADVAEVDIDIGMVTAESDWSTSMSTFPNLLSKTEQEKYVNTGLSVHATSAQSGLITLAVRGNKDMFSSPLASTWHMEIEDLITMHFLEDSKYQAMLSLIASGGAWSMVREEGTGYLEIALSSQATRICRTETIPGDFTCAIQKSIYRRQVVKDNVVHPLASGVNTHSEANTVSWLQRNVLGSTDFSKDFATKWTRTVRAHHNINDRYNKAWFVNPMYNWNLDSTAPAQSIFSLTDRTIIVAVLALEDENFAYGTGGNVRRRMLLQVQSDGVNGQAQQTIQNIANTAKGEQMPTIKNSAIVPDAEIARMVGIADQTWVKTGSKIQINMPVWYTEADVREEIQTRLNKKIPMFSDGVGFVHVVQFLMTPSVVAGAGAGGRRLLAAGDTVPWTGTVNTMWTSAQPTAGLRPQSVYIEWLRCALWLGNITTDRAGSPIPSCSVSTGGEEGPPADFIEDFWIQTCSDYALPTTNCSKVLQIMKSPVMNTPVPTPVSKVNVSIGFQVQINFNDSLLTINTMSAFDLREVRLVLANVFNVPAAQIELDKMSTARRLLNIGVMYNILVDAEYGVKDAAWMESKRQGVLTALAAKGYQVTVVVTKYTGTAITTTTAARVATTTPPPATKEDKKENNNIVWIIVGVVGGVVVILSIVFFIFSSRSKGPSARMTGVAAHFMMHPQRYMPLQRQDYF